MQLQCEEKFARKISHMTEVSNVGWLEKALIEP